MDLKQEIETEQTIDNDECDEPTMSADLENKAKANESEANKTILKAAEEFLTATDQLGTSVDTKIQKYLNTVQVLLDTVITEIKEKQENNDESTGSTEDKILEQKSRQQDTKLTSTNLLENTKKSAANTYTDFALNAISSEHYDVAETFLNNAQKICPTEKARKLLETVQKNKENAEEEEFISLAKAAIFEQDYEFAESMLTYLKIERKSKAAQHLLEVFKHLNSKQHTGTDTKKYRDEIYRRIALNMMLENRLTAAESIMILAEKIYHNSFSFLHENIRGKLYGANDDECMKKKRHYEDKFIMFIDRNTNNETFYNRYMRLAIRAFMAGKNNIARDFINEVEKFCPSEMYSSLLEAFQLMSQPLK